VRSTISGLPLVEVTTVDTPPAFSSPGIVSTCSVRCVCASSVRSCTIVVPSSVRKRTVAFAAVRFGLATSTSRSKNGPVAPSASV
jgi:hypothetical protein